MHLTFRYIKQKNNLYLADELIYFKVNGIWKS